MASAWRRDCGAVAVGRTFTPATVNGACHRPGARCRASFAEIRTITIDTEMRDSVGYVACDGVHASFLMGVASYRDRHDSGIERLDQGTVTTLLGIHEATFRYSNLLTDIALARETGWDGIELLNWKVQRFLDSGGSISDVTNALGDLRPLSLMYIQDIHRSDPERRAELFEECRSMCDTAASLGCGRVQLLTGPSDTEAQAVSSPSIAKSELCRETVANLRRICAIGEEYGVGFYLEGLTWTPLHSLGEVLGIIREVGCSNLGTVLDFWQLWNSGVSADDLRDVDRGLVVCVHVGDALDDHGARGGGDEAGRDVWLGDGKIPLQDWVSAVGYSGFEGWWSTELFGPRIAELELRPTFERLRESLARLCQASLPPSAKDAESGTEPSG